MLCGDVRITGSSSGTRRPASTSRTGTRPSLTGRTHDDATDTLTADLISLVTPVTDVRETADETPHVCHGTQLSSREVAIAFVAVVFISIPR